MRMGLVGIYVHIVGTGHYADMFCWFLCVWILSLYLGSYQRLALLTISGTGSLIPRHNQDAVVEIGTNAVLYIVV